MTLLDSHLEQISLSSVAIAELPFPAPKIFTNSLLHSHDITTLIRDTEVHERALFTLQTPEQSVRQPPQSAASRSVVPGLNGVTESYTGISASLRNLRPGSAVATLLGGALGEQIRRESAKESNERGEIDVSLLLQGAEKLCGVYPIPGAPERIAVLRTRYEQLNSSIARYESKVAKQMIQLEKMNKHKGDHADFGDDEGKELDMNADDGDVPHSHVTEDDLRREDEEIRELEKKKRALEDRVSGMERDLGGLLR